MSSPPENAVRAASLLFEASSRVKVALAAIAALPFVVALVYGWMRPDLFLWADSPGYSNWHPVRTAPYPLFLDLIPSALVLTVQLGLLAAALSWLSLQVWKLTSSFLFVAASALLQIANPYIWFLQGSVMSEALTTPLLILLAGLLLNYTIGGRRADLLPAALCAGVIAATRPSCLPIIVIPLLAALLSPSHGGSRSWRVLLAALLMAISPVALERALAHLKFGDQVLSLAGRHSYAKGAILDVPNPVLARPTVLESRLLLLAERDFAAIRAEIKAAPAGPIRDTIRLNYEVCLQYQCTDLAIADLNLSEQARAEGMARVGQARILNGIPAYLALAWDEYRGFWLHHSDKHPTLASRYNAHLTARGQLPLAKEMDIYAKPIPASEQQQLYYVTRPFYALIGVLLAVLTIVTAALVAAGKRHPFLLMSFFSAVAVQGLLVFAAFTGVGIPRYSMGLWPLISGSLLFGTLYLAGLARLGRLSDQRWWRSLTGSGFDEASAVKGNSS